LGRIYINDQLTTKDGEIARYRVALGIDPASKGALIELNNQEMQAKAASTVVKMRDLCFLQEKKIAEIQSQINAKTLDEKGRLDRIQAVHRELSEQFVRTLRSDAFNVDNELRRRLGPQAVATIIGITPSIVSDDGTRIDILSLVLSGTSFSMGFDINFVCVLADGIERMAKLLPP
jgi:hypothetical protein